MNRRPQPDPTPSAEPPARPIGRPAAAATSFSRRRFLGWPLAGGAVAAAAAVVVAEADNGTTPAPRPARRRHHLARAQPPRRRPPASGGHPDGRGRGPAPRCRRSSSPRTRRPATAWWEVTARRPAGDHRGVRRQGQPPGQGETVTLRVSSKATDVPRRGLPDGLLPGHRRPAGLARRPRCPEASSQAPPALIAPTNTVECSWSPSIQLDGRRHLAARLLPAQAGRVHRRAWIRAALRPGRRVDVGDPPHEARHQLAGLQPLGRVLALLRQRRRGPELHPGLRGRQLRRPGPHRVVSTALTATTGPAGASDFVGNELPGHLPGRAARPRRVLLDRRRPARAARACWPTTGPCSASATTSTGRPPMRTGRRGGHPEGAQHRLPRRQRLLPPDPARAVATRARPARRLLQVGRRGSR